MGSVIAALLRKFSGNQSDSALAEQAVSQPLVERLESRQFLCATPAADPSTSAEQTTALKAAAITSAKITTLASGFDGTYSGNAVINGTTTIPLNVTVASSSTRVKFTVALRQGFTIKASFKVKFNANANGTYSSNFTTPIGNGKATYKNGKITVTGSFTPLFAEPFTIKVTASKGASTSSVKTSSLAPLTTSSLKMVTQAVNPLVGNFSGNFTLLGIGSLPFKVVTTTKAGSTRLPMVITITVPNFGDIQLSFGVSPNGKGAFTTNLGTTSDQGTLSGHLTSAGKLVLTFTVPGVGSISGSGKRV